MATASERVSFYRLVLNNVFKLVMGLAVLLALYFVLAPQLAAYQETVAGFIRDQLAPRYVLSLFYLSESLLGMLPPDLFILWARARFPDLAYTMVGVLAGLSYLGGVTAYAIGARIEHLPRVHRFIFVRHAQQVEFMQRWGGPFIVVAAILPIPFAIASTVAGLVEFPLRSYLLYALARFLRFYLYAIAIFNFL